MTEEATPLRPGTHLSNDKTRVKVATRGASHTVRVHDAFLDLSLWFSLPPSEKTPCSLVSWHHRIAEFGAWVAGTETVVVWLEEKARVHDHIGMLSQTVDLSEAVLGVRERVDTARKEVVLHIDGDEHGGKSHHGAKERPTSGSVNHTRRTRTVTFIPAAALTTENSEVARSAKSINQPTNQPNQRTNNKTK